MGALAADGKRAPLQVSHSDLKHVVARAVVDGERDLDRRNLDIAHHAGAVDVELAVIVLALFIGQSEEGSAQKQIAVILPRALQQFVVFALVHAFHGLVI